MIDDLHARSKDILLVQWPNEIAQNAGHGRVGTLTSYQAYSERGVHLQQMFTYTFDM